MTGLPLSGRVAIVTGAGRNIGRAIALDLARHGADVVVHVRTSLDQGEETAKQVAETGRRSVVVAADLKEADGADRLVAQTQEMFGRLDIVVNNAALRREASIFDIHVAEWREVLAVCLDAPFYVIRAAAELLRGSDHGSVVNIGGMTGHTGAPERPHVVAAKAGLVGLTKALAIDFAPFGVTVNCVVPGMIDTERGGSSSAHAPAHQRKRHIPLERHGMVDEVAGAVTYLCRPESRFVTGQTLHVNGGTYLP